MSTVHDAQVRAETLRQAVAMLRKQTEGAAMERDHLNPGILWAADFLAEFVERVHMLPEVEATS
jgi:hypothetical protein